MNSAIDKVFDRFGFHVSRETVDKLEIYFNLLNKWQKAINLVSEATLADAPERHFFDSAQLLRYIPETDVTLADMGSGAGFPGMVLAILGVKRVHLIESDVRKATFLREVSRETATPVTIHDKRVESAEIPSIDVFTARALAPLRDLLGFMADLSTQGHTAYGLFLKGLNSQEELDQAAKRWAFTHELWPSQTDISGKIIKISNLEQK